MFIENVGTLDTRRVHSLVREGTPMRLTEMARLTA